MEFVEIMQRFHLMELRHHEFVNGKAVTGRPISHITGYEEAVGTYDVTWTSVDNVNHTGTYQHKGRLIVSSIDTNRPNHS